VAVVADNSLFCVINIATDDDWEQLRNRCDDYLASDDYKKIHDFLKDNVHSVIIEKRYTDKDYRDTFSNFYSKKLARYPSTTYRMHFFRAQIREDDLFSLDAHKDDYIGYIIVRPTQVSSIGRTVLDPSKISNLQGVICRTDYKVHLFGTEFKVNGFPFISQDTDVTICAHAATWMDFRYFSERYPIYREIYPYQISQLCGDLSRGRLVPSKGLTAFQITEIFSKYGFYPEVYFRGNYPNFDKLLYYYIESGLPVVACLHSKQHALTVIGHVSDYTIDAKSNSEEYLIGYVVNDDNHLPYQIIWRDGLPKSAYSSEYSISQIDGFVVPLYEKMYLSAEHIETFSDALIDHPSFGVDANSKAVAKKDLIKRIYLTTSNAFKAFRRERGMPFDLQTYLIQIPMPKFIWVCELSTPALYHKKEVIGEIIFDATANHLDRFAFLAIHYPDFILVRDISALGDAPKFISAKLGASAPLPYAMFENNLKEV
jgi:hypothetical protein